MVIFHCYVSLPEGNTVSLQKITLLNRHIIMNHRTKWAVASIARIKKQRVCAMVRGWIIQSYTCTICWIYGYIYIYLVGGLESGTFFIFHFIYEIIHQPLTFIGFKMVETTNQIVFMAISSLSMADLYGFMYGFIMIYSHIHVLYFGFKWIYNDLYIIDIYIYIYPPV